MNSSLDRGEITMHSRNWVGLDGDINCKRRTSHRMVSVQYDDSMEMHD